MLLLALLPLLALLLLLQVRAMQQPYCCRLMQLYR
jgi:hypothetical protein